MDALGAVPAHEAGHHRRAALREDAKGGAAGAGRRVVFLAVHGRALGRLLGAKTHDGGVLLALRGRSQDVGEPRSELGVEHNAEGLFALRSERSDRLLRGPPSLARCGGQQGAFGGLKRAQRDLCLRRGDGRCGYNLLMSGPSVFGGLAARPFRMPGYRSRVRDRSSQ